MNRQLLISRKKYVISRIYDITKLSNIYPKLTSELRDLIHEYKILTKTIDELPVKEKPRRKEIKYPHEFYRDKLYLFFSKDN